jgi:hypothetical protein
MLPAADLILVVDEDGAAHGRTDFAIIVARSVARQHQTAPSLKSIKAVA